jgi:(p)ppGpp synthase/HD superfamily hydrolase
VDHLLKKIKDFADRAHGEQMRKYTPERYIVHPIRVMRTCEKYTNDITILGAALLHDVLEDTPVTKEEIGNFLSQFMDSENVNKTVMLVEELTDVYIKSDYPQWNRHKRKQKEAERLGKVSGEAQTIKYADILDNSAEIVNQETGFAGKYLLESENLLEKMTKGNKELHEKTIETVKDCLRQLKGKKEN